MRKNSTVFPAKKMQMYKQATELPKKYKVMALVKMNKVRASQILDLRKKARLHPLSLEAGMQHQAAFPLPLATFMINSRYGGIHSLEWTASNLHSAVPL